MANRERPCVNCGTTEYTARVSFDMDLPALVLCQVCQLTIVADRQMFDDMGKRHRATKRS